MKAIYVANGKIERVEDREGAKLVLDGRDCELPAGARLLPGFVDTHCHLIGPGQMADLVDLKGANSASECIRRVGEGARTHAGGWLKGFGWNQQGWGDLENFTRTELDGVVPDVPVALYRIDTHAVLANTSALNLAGLHADTELDGGEVVLGPDGTPTGLLIDEAVKMLEQAMPAPDADTIARWYKYGVDECLSFGLTEVHDMTVHPDWLEPMTRLANRGDMRLRCAAFLDGKHRRWKALPGPRVLGKNLEAVGVKFFSDGALGSRGAFLLEPYSDAPDTRGLAIMTAAELIEAARDPIRAGFGIATHAIGDGANRLVLEAYRELRTEFHGALLRIEHAQIVHPNDVPTFLELNVIPTIQPTHCTSDAAMAEERLGPERCAYAYGWKSLLDAGRPLLGGSDFPIESPDPLLGLRAFVDRDPGNGPWYPEQAIDRDTALRAYTQWAPLGVPTQPHRGVLRPGYDADLVVLSGDPFEDRDASVLMTIVGGEIVYRRS